MINRENGGQKSSKKRSEAEKVGRRKWIIRTLKRMEERQKRIDRRTRMLAAGLRELLVLEEDYISVVACHNEIDKAILSALREADAVGRSSAELSDILRIDHRRVSEYIDRMNKRMVLELGEQIIIKNSPKGKWKLIPKLRRDLEATH